MTENIRRQALIDALDNSILELEKNFKPLLKEILLKEIINKKTKIKEEIKIEEEIILI